jgi:hypothetical protein
MINFKSINHGFARIFHRCIHGGITPLNYINCNLSYSEDWGL